MLGQNVGRFRILARLGEGGMASVWKAEDKLLGRAVALKVLAQDLARSATARRRFLREARIAASLDHPGIAAVLDAGEHGDVIYIALALVDGMTLAERITRAPLSWEEACQIVSAAGSAISYAHAHGVIHRDVSSRNIMIARDGGVFVLDFGLALAAGASRFTSSSAALGTVSYIAPEVASGGEADERSDVYGLGVVFYEALTGTLPFGGERPEVVLFSVVNESPPPPRARRPDLPESVERIALRAMAREPADRFQSADEFVTELRAALGATPADPAAAKFPSYALSVPFGGASSHGVSAQRFIVVLPFEDAAPTEQDRARHEALGGGLAGTISAALADLPGLAVIPPPKSADASDLGALARQVGANLLLRGSVQHSGAQLRITFHLIDPHRGRHLAGGVLDGTRTGLFDLEDRLVSEVRSALGADPRDVRAGARRPSDPAANERYVQALGYLRHFENEASVDGAITLLQHLLETDGEDVRVHAALGRACLYKYRLTRERMWEAKAAAACERAVALDPTAPEALVTLGDLHLAVGRPQDAARDYGRALDNRRDLPDASLGLAEAYEAQGLAAEATATCEDAVARWPNDWRGYSRLGLLHYNRGEFGKAVDPWEKLARLAPDNSRAWLHLGALYYQLDRLEDAAEAYRRSIDLHPSASAFTSLGSVLYYLGRNAEAIETLERGARLRPSDPLVWGHLGSACRWTDGMESKSADALDRAIELIRDRLSRHPREAADWALLASWLANRGRYAEAHQALERWLALSPHNARLMALAGTTYEHLGYREQAVCLLRDAVRFGHPPGHLIRDPTLAALRQDPVFATILASSPASAGDDSTKHELRGGPQ
jgi:serine/threonine-protein kinase